MELRTKRLSERLEFPLQNLLPGEPVWDICCDHGLVGLQALARGLTNKVHFCDPSKAVMNQLSSQLLGYGYMQKGRSACYWSYDLQEKEVTGWVLKAQELPVYNLSGVVIAMGVGSETLLQIMAGWSEQDPKWMNRVKRVVLGSHAKSEKLEPVFCEWENFSHQKKIVIEKKRERVFYVLDSSELSLGTVPSSARL